MTFDTDAINNIKFTQGFRGYDTAEVDEFLDDMIREIEKLNNTIKSLKEEVAKEKRKNQLNQQEIDRLTQMNEALSTEKASVPIAAPKPVEEEPKPIKIKKPTSMEDIKGTPEYEEMKQILTDTLLSAQQHAEKLVKDAQERAGKLIEEGERKAQDRVVALNVEIVENQEKLNAITAMVLDAKQRFKRKFQDQIAALDSIVVSDEKEKEDEPQKYYVEEKIKAPEPEPVPVVKSPVEPEGFSFEEVINEKVETKQEEKKSYISGDPEVNTFDFAAVKKSFAKDTSEAPKENIETPKPISPKITPSQPNSVSFENTDDEEDDNQQYIELALSAYNDNKHHNSDYPNAPSNIKINEDDDNGGIYQPENRSVLSSVIEEILNNKRNDD